MRCAQLDLSVLPEGRPDEHWYTIVGKSGRSHGEIQLKMEIQLVPAVQSVLADRSAVAPLETVVTRPFTDIDSLSSEAPDASHSQADAESGLVTEEHDISSMPVEHATPDENGMVETLERDAE